MHRLSLIQPERDELEASFIQSALSQSDDSPEERTALASQCFAEADQALVRWREKQAEAENRSGRGWLHRIAWDRANRQAQIPL